MKIAIAFFGLPRCSRLAWPSIEEHILKKLPPEAEVQCFYHFYKQSEVINPHSNENGSLDADNYDVFQGFKGILENPSEVVPLLGLDRFRKYGDAWKDDFNSTKNLLLQLHSLKKVTNLVEEYDPNCVVFARPDLVYHDDIENIYYNHSAVLPDAVFLPEWQWGIGVNDRFAIAGKSTYKIYGSRMNEALNYCDQGNRPLHAERLLKYVLLKYQKKIFTLKTKASRVRISGDFAKEKFQKNISFFSPISNSHKRFLFLRVLKTNILMLKKSA